MKWQKTLSINQKLVLAQRELSNAKQNYFNQFLHTKDSNDRMDKLQGDCWSNLSISAKRQVNAIRRETDRQIQNADEGFNQNPNRDTDRAEGSTKPQLLDIMVGSVDKIDAIIRENNAMSSEIRKTYDQEQSTRTSLLHSFIYAGLRKKRAFSDLNRTREEVGVQGELDPALTGGNSPTLLERPTEARGPNTDTTVFSCPSNPPKREQNSGQGTNRDSLLDLYADTSTEPMDIIDPD